MSLTKGTVQSSSTKILDLFFKISPDFKPNLLQISSWFPLTLPNLFKFNLLQFLRNSARFLLVSGRKSENNCSELFFEIILKNSFLSQEAHKFKSLQRVFLKHSSSLLRFIILNDLIEGRNSRSFKIFDIFFHFFLGNHNNLLIKKPLS